MDRIDTPPLADQLCLDLYTASRALTHAYRPALTALGLTYPQYLVMLALWEEDGRTVRDLADSLHLDHGTLSPLLRRMEEHGLLTRRRNPSDERYVEVQLTESGNALRVHADRIHCEMKDALALTESEFVELQATLRLLTKRVG